MPRYMLSIHTVDDEPGPPMSDEQMQHSWRDIQAIEADMQSSGTWVFSGRLHAAETATVVRESGGELLTTDGPFVESKEHLGGFYIIESADLDAALGWAARVMRATSRPIEVWPFADTAGG